MVGGCKFRKINRPIKVSLSFLPALTGGITKYLDACYLPILLIFYLYQNLSVMKKFSALSLIAITILFSCSPKSADLSKQAAEQIKQADIAMSNEAAKEGFFKTLLSYADTNVVKLKEGEYPVIGKGELIKYWAGKNDIKTLTWEPFKAESSASGDLGYTLGKWKMQGKDTAFYGNYYTIWKKQSDGRWKFVVDGGNNTPK